MDYTPGQMMQKNRNTVSISPSNDDNSTASHSTVNSNHPSKKQLTDEAQMNIECNRIESETTQAALDGGTSPAVKVLQMPYEGLRVMLKIKETRITSNYRKRNLSSTADGLNA